MKTELIRVLFGFTNCYVISDERSGGCAVIDPGGNPEKIEKLMADHSLTLEYILLTHGHYDHTGAVSALREKHPECAVYLNGADRIVSEEKRIKRLFPPVENTLNACEGAVIRLGETEIRVMETPGHSKGSVCYIAENCIFSGDTLFASTVGRTDFFGGDEEQMRRSLARLLALEGNYTVFPGHMEAAALETLRRNAPFFQSGGKICEKKR